jgi:hypothetical protein
MRVRVLVCGERGGEVVVVVGSSGEGERKERSISSSPSSGCCSFVEGLVGGREGPRAGPNTGPRIGPGEGFGAGDGAMVCWGAAGGEGGGGAVRALETLTQAGECDVRPTCCIFGV